MLINFNTESLSHAQAALLLYAMYKSRDNKSSLSGISTWERCQRYIKGATLKSSNTAEFVEEFCKKADVASIKPKYLRDIGMVQVSDGTYMESEGVHEYQTALFADDELLELFRKESTYLILLVRERIQRERFEQNEIDD